MIEDRLQLEPVHTKKVWLEINGNLRYDEMGEHIRHSISDLREHVYTMRNDKTLKHTHRILLMIMN